MRVSGFAAAVVVAAGVALVPVSAEAAVFTLNSCLTGACGSFTGSVMITLTDSVTDARDVNVVVANNTNGEIDYLRFNYAPTPTGSAQIADFTATPAGSLGAPSVSFGSGNDAGYAYNVAIDFPNGAAARFDAGESVSFTLGSSSNFDFNASTFAPVLAHVISLSIGGESVKLGSGGGTQSVPEPASIALFGLAALAFAHKFRRR